jgi:hypothetical protein
MPECARLFWLSLKWRSDALHIAECEKARQLDPLFKSNGSMSNAYLYFGEYDKFLESLPDDKDSAFVVFCRSFAEYYKQDWEQAAKDLDRTYALDPTLYTQTGEGFSDAIAHKNVEGLELLSEVIGATAKLPTMGVWVVCREFWRGQLTQILSSHYVLYSHGNGGYRSIQVS